MTKIIIITDLDGTLLHPVSYSFEDAVPALEEIREADIPAVLCSSKTKAEIEVYRKCINNPDPFISENGGGIFIPEGYFAEHEKNRSDDEYTVTVLGKPYSIIRAVFHDIRETTGIRVKGFGDMTLEEVALLTGMQLSDACLSKERDFDEPFIFEKGEDRVTEFLDAIESAGLHWTQGRFYHILGDNDKGKAVKILMDHYKRAYGSVVTIGLGDSFNDLPLLQNVDYPVLVQKEDGSYEGKIKLQNIIRADGIGPVGWNREVIKLIRRIRENEK
ncbi:MAG: HAD-IIB family hydrolase [Nitrospirae bacterium]|nr:HAD-IIB family hydrolase [Nitrospirota bacterium]